MHLFSARRVVGVTLLGRLTRSWVERDLQGGDLSCLRDFALFRNRRPASAVIDRLCERGFMAKTARWRHRMRPRFRLSPHAERLDHHRQGIADATKAEN